MCRCQNKKEDIANTDLTPCPLSWKKERGLVRDGLGFESILYLLDNHLL